MRIDDIDENGDSNFLSLLSFKHNALEVCVAYYFSSTTSSTLDGSSCSRQFFFASRLK